MPNEQEQFDFFTHQWEEQEMEVSTPAEPKPAQPKPAQPKPSDTITEEPQEVILKDFFVCVPFRIICSIT